MTARRAQHPPRCRAVRCANAPSLRRLASPPTLALAAALIGGCGGGGSARTSALPRRTGGSPVAQRRPGAQRPNIVFVLTGDPAWNLVRYMPHVVAMQHEGETFSNYFVTDSLCCPSRASILT